MTKDKPTDVSSGSIAPSSTGKTLAGEEKRHDVMKAETGHYKVEGSPVTFVQSSAQAVDALWVASSTATETGHPDVAKAAQAVQIHIQHNVFILGDGATVNQQQSFDIDQNNSVTQKYVEQVEEKLTAAGVDFFDCQEQRDNCLERAKNGWAKGECWTLYLGCLSTKAVSAFKP